MLKLYNIINLKYMTPNKWRSFCQRDLLGILKQTLQLEIDYSLDSYIYC